MKERTPPRFFEWCLQRLITGEQAREDILGDLREEFSQRAGRSSALAARLWYRWAACGTLWWVVRERISGRPKRRTRQGEDRMEQLWTDAKLALRGMRRAPVFTVTAILTLALAIGANSAVFSVIHAVLLKPLPYPEPEQLVSVAHTAPGLGFRSVPQTAASYLVYRQENRAFEDIAAWRPALVSVTGLAQPERVRSLFVSDGLFPLLRATPALGRLFDSRDATPQSPLTVILSYGYWQRRFGGQADAVGKTLRVESLDWEIIGVMPSGFRFLSEDAAFYLPIRLGPPTPETPSFDYHAVARLRPQTTLEEANRDLGRMIPLIRPYFAGLTPEKFQEWRLGPNVRPLREVLVGGIGTMLWMLLGTVGLVLLIACVNVANLFLVRAESRRREFSVRRAMGASGLRLARQFLSESIGLGLVGGLAGLGLALAGIRLLTALAEQDFPRIEEVSMSPAVLIFTLALSVLAGLVFGLFPLLQGRTELAPALKEGDGRSGEGRGRHRSRKLLAGLQVSLALVLLVGSGLMLRSFQALLEVDTGFQRPQELLTFRLGLPRSEAPHAREIVRIHMQILDRLSAIPGVVSSGASSSLPLEGWSNNNVIYVEDFPLPEGRVAPLCLYQAIAGDYFSTLGVPLLSGRTIQREDIEDRRTVAVITENLAREFWGDPASAIGKRIRHHPDDPWREVVGVVGNLNNASLSEPRPWIVFWPLVVEDFLGMEVWARRTMAFAVRTERPQPMSLLPEVRQAVWSVNPNLPLSGVRTLDELQARSMERTVFILAMLGISAAVAVLLGTVGIYGTVSYMASLRTREIGVRLALGAQRRDVSRMVLVEAAVVALLGVGAGLAAAAGLTRFLSAQLYGVEAGDPLTYAVAAMAVGLVALLASWLPAQRASRVDPIQVLRWE